MILRAIWQRLLCRYCSLCLYCRKVTEKPNKKQLSFRKLIVFCKRFRLNKSKSLARFSFCYLEFAFGSFCGFCRIFRLLSVFLDGCVVGFVGSRFEPLIY